MPLPDPAGDFLEPVVDYDKYAGMYTHEDFTHEQKVEAVKMVEIMVLEVLEHYYPDETFRRYLLRAKARESEADSKGHHSGPHFPSSRQRRITLKR